MVNGGRTLQGDLEERELHRGQVNFSSEPKPDEEEGEIIATVSRHIAVCMSPMDSFIILFLMSPAHWCDVSRPDSSCT